MNELNLTFFMLLGYAQAHWFMVSLFIMAALVLNLTAGSQKGAFWQPGLLKQTLVAFVGLFVMLFFSIPSLTGSSFSMLGYWVDWVLLVIMAGGYASALSVVVYPVLRLRQAFKASER